MWPVALSGRLPVKALVGHYPTNKLIGRETIPDRKKLSNNPDARETEYSGLPPVSKCYTKVKGTFLTCYSPVRHSCTPESALPFDLHVLSTPPAFVLSQDQTLRKKTTGPDPRRTRPDKNNKRTTPTPSRKTDRTEKSTQRKTMPAHNRPTQKTLTEKHAVELSRNNRTTQPEPHKPQPRTRPEQPTKKQATRNTTALRQLDQF